MIGLEPIGHSRPPRRNPSEVIYTGGLLPTGERDFLVFAEGKPSLPLLPAPSLPDLLPREAKEYVEGIFDGKVDKAGQQKAREEIAEGILSIVGPKKFVKAFLTLLGSETPTGAGADPPRTGNLAPNPSGGGPDFRWAITTALLAVGRANKEIAFDTIRRLLHQAFPDLLASMMPPDP